MFHFKLNSPVNIIKEKERERKRNFFTTHSTAKLIINYEYVSFRTKIFSYLNIILNILIIYDEKDVNLITT